MIAKLRQQITRLSLAGVLPLLLLLAFAPVAVVQAQDGPELQTSLCGGAEFLQLGAGGDCDSSVPQDNINDLITSVVNIFSMIVGVIAVIFIVYGGFKYITSGGDSGKISAAQQSIIYAIVGLVVVALAQIIVRFVLFRATAADGGAGTGF